MVLKSNNKSNTNMTTNNIISTPEITGNIGSCEVKTANAQTGNSFWTSEYTTTFSNSCTGQVISTNSYTSYDGVWGGLMIGLILFFFILVAWAN